VTGATGISATVFPRQRIRATPSPVTSPMTLASRSHLSKISRTSSSLPFFATMSIRSCDSESISS
jgi:hypothetical protein